MTKQAQPTAGKEPKPLKQIKGRNVFIFAVSDSVEGKLNKGQNVQIAGSWKRTHQAAGRQPQTRPTSIGFEIKSLVEEKRLGHFVTVGNSLNADRLRVPAMNATMFAEPTPENSVFVALIDPTTVSIKQVEEVKKNFPPYAFCFAGYDAR